MAKFEGPLEDVLGICPTCQYWTQYKEGEITIEQMRENCSLRCKQHPDLKNNKIKIRKLSGNNNSRWT